MIKIALLIPATSYRRNWTTMEESHIYQTFIPSFFDTVYTDDELVSRMANSKYEYMLYFGYDKGDPIFSKSEEKKKLKDLVNTMKNKNRMVFDIKFVELNIEKGYLTKMWNHLYALAIADSYDYFYQFGDDLKFLDKGWNEYCISTLKKHNDVGMTCAQNTNGNPSILTQSCVSRKHYEIFKLYFPTEIRNWWCDNWINDVYKPKFLYKTKLYKLINMSDTEKIRNRYIAKKMNADNYLEIVNKYKIILCKHLNIPIPVDYSKPIDIGSLTPDELKEFTNKSTKIKLIKMLEESQKMVKKLSSEIERKSSGIPPRLRPQNKVDITERLLKRNTSMTKRTNYSLKANYPPSVNPSRLPQAVIRNRNKRTHIAQHKSSPLLRNRNSRSIRPSSAVLQRKSTTLAIKRLARKKKHSSLYNERIVS